MKEVQVDLLVRVPPVSHSPLKVYARLEVREGLRTESIEYHVACKIGILDVKLWIYLLTNFATKSFQINVCGTLMLFSPFSCYISFLFRLVILFNVFWMSIQHKVF